MNTSAPGRGRIFVIAAFSLSCFGLLLFFWLAFGGPIPLKPQGYRVQIAFTDAATLADQADVRVAGVSIGKVVDKQLAPAGETGSTSTDTGSAGASTGSAGTGSTVATVEIQSEYAPLPADTKAILRQKTLLGETYVELALGKKDGPKLKEGARLADGQVSRAVEFDELLRIFDEPTRIAFRQWQASIARAGAGRGRDLNDALGSLQPFTENAQTVVDVLDHRRAALRNLVHNAGKTFEEVTRDEESLSTLVQRNSELFGELADRRDALAESIRILPTFLDETKTTLARVGTFSQNAEPLLRDLDPVLDDLQPTLASLHGVAPDLQHLFDNLDPLIDAGDTGLPALSRTLRGLDPTLAAAGPFLRQANPFLRFLEFNQVKVADFMGVPPSTLAGKRATLPGSKSTGHVVPQIIMLGQQALPALRRSAENRGNAYPPPDTRVDPDSQNLPSFDCKPSGEKGPTNTPGCKVAGPMPFGGLDQYFPQVREAGPGGKLP